MHCAVYDWGSTCLLIEREILLAQARYHFCTAFRFFFFFFYKDGESNMYSYRVQIRYRATVICYI